MKTNKIIALDYNGELGYAASIKDVVTFVFKILKISVEEFLDFKNKDGLSNREIIFDNYSLSEKIKYNLADKDGNITKSFKDVSVDFRCPYVTLYSDADYVTKDVILNNSSLLVSDFSEKELDDEEKGDIETAGRKFVTNRFFFEKVNIIPKSEKVTPNNAIKGTRRQYLNPRVWIWCKSLSENGEFNTASIFDLSPFVKNIDTSTSDTGGNFSLGLLNIEGIINVRGNLARGIWSPRADRYIKFNNNGKKNYLFKNFINSRYRVQDGEQEEITNEIENNNEELGIDVMNKNSNQKENESEQLEELVISVENQSSNFSISSDSFFKNLISENDVIFITFRDDEDNVIDTCDDFFISNDKLPGMDWDMIGLIDNNKFGTSYEGNEQTVNVGGRDLMKLLIEDGSYFFANSFSEDNVRSIFQNINLDKKGDGSSTTNSQMENNGTIGANRLFMTGMIDMLYAAEARNVHFVMNLLISTLSNIEICPSRLFEYYRNKTEFQIPNYETVKK